MRQIHDIYKASTTNVATCFKREALTSVYFEIMFSTVILLSNLHRFIIALLLLTLLTICEIPHLLVI